jgi:hypothetical protein
LLRIVDDPSVAHRGRVGAIHPISFRGKLRSIRALRYQKLYQATEIRSRSAATRCMWIVRRRASETF